MKPFDNYEIHGCLTLAVINDDGEQPTSVEQCEDSEAEFWTLYGHLPEGGVEAIGDFKTRQLAEEVYQRITGQPFGSHDQNAATARAMVAAQKLVVALEDAREWIANGEVDGVFFDEGQVLDAIDETLAETVKADRRSA